MNPERRISFVVLDNFADATLTGKEAFGENGDVLENLAPPPATIIAATQDRIFLAGLSDNPYRVVYSKLRGESEVAAFHDALAIELPPDGGDITALGFLNETLVVFKETAVFALPGMAMTTWAGARTMGRLACCHPTAARSAPNR